MANYYNKDLYKILNLTYEASVDEIKKSYKKLVRIYHPDAQGSQADASKFKEIQEAYEILSDEEQRKRYDILHGFYTEKLKKDFEKKNFQRKNKYEEYVEKAKNNINYDDKDNFSKSINEALDNLFHLNNQKETKENKKIKDGDDIDLDVSISLFEAVNGTNRKVNILHTQPCPNCEGRKFINDSSCPMCNGTGQISLQKKINVKIPKGVKQGSKVRIKKEGNKGLNGGKDGDLYLIINIEKNKFFEIDGLNLLCTLPISVTEAVFGADIPILLPSGNITVKIPAMTSSGQKFRLASMGLENKSKSKKGDVIVTVLIKLPENLSSKEKELYLNLSKISNDNPRKDMITNE